MNSAIAFVTIGPTIPYYFRIALFQARLFNTCAIYLVADERALKLFALEPEWGITVVARESLPVGDSYESFHTQARLDTSFRNGFWTYVVERFFVLEGLMRKFGLKNVVHLEGDNMIYADVDRLAPSIGAHYENIAVPFDHDKRAVAGLIYFKSIDSITFFNTYISKIFTVYPGVQLNDMQLLGHFRTIYGSDAIDSLPVVPDTYQPPMRNLLGETSATAELYANHARDLGFVFDANALGQYIDGIDPRNNMARCTVGFVNETAMYMLSRYQFAFRPDRQGRLISILIDGKDEWPIANLHVHSKNLERFLSRPDRTPRSVPQVHRIEQPFAIGVDEIITSERLQALADISVLDQHSYEFNTSIRDTPAIRTVFFKGDRSKLIVDGPHQMDQLQTADILFVYTHLLDSFVRDILCNITRPFVLVSHGSDYKITQKYVPLLDDPRVLHWFGQNVEITHAKLTPLPIGLANRQWPHGDVDALAEVMRGGIPKEKTLYVNINPRTNIAHRGKVLSALGGKSFVRMGESLPYKAYLADMARSRFCCSPEGDGTDCHGTWEALYLGVIPLVDRSAWLDAFEDLPIIAIDDWSMIDEEFLDASWAHFSERRFDYRKLTVRYWKAEILSRVHRSIC